MPEFRKDPVIGRWIIIATERAKRPHSYHEAPVSATPPDACPFCPGNEAHTPPEVLAYRDDAAARNSGGWWVRVVPNKFPALEPSGPVRRVGEGMYDMITGVGAHEVVIESPDHYSSMGAMGGKQVEEILWAYRDRILDLKQDSRLSYILIFKNHGSEAGASLDHPHSQIIALPIVPKRVQEELEGSARYWEYKERCVYCDIIHQELMEHKRIVAESDYFISLLPFASRFPYEMWIIPKEHSLFYHDMQKTEVQDLARVMRTTLAKLRILLDNPPYNVMIHTSPVNDPTVRHYHWHIEIIPKMTKVGGYEWGTGFYINPIPPEEAAAFLAEVELPQTRIVDVEATRAST